MADDQLASPSNVIYQKYGNCPSLRKSDNQFYAIGSMNSIFGNVLPDCLDRFTLISLDLENVPLSVRGHCVSLVLSGGRASGVSSIFLIRGLERDGFLLCKISVSYLLYRDLMKNMEKRRSRKLRRCVACCHGFVILEMEDEELYVFDVLEETFVPFETRSKMRAIASNMMSSTIAIYYYDHTLWKRDLKEKDGKESEIPLQNISPLKHLSKYASDLYIFVHEDNSLYIYRDDEETDGFTDVGDNETTLIETDMFMSPIKQIASGYSHFVVLLENGKCWTRGMDNYGQVTGKLGGEGAKIEHFHPFLHNSEPVISVCCSSLTTTIETEDDIIIVGEISQTFQRLEHPLCLGMSSYWVHKKEFPDETISLGPWHGFIYRKTFDNHHSSKSLQYFRNNLKTLSTSSVSVLSDVSIQWLMI